MPERRFELWHQTQEGDYAIGEGFNALDELYEYCFNLPGFEVSTLAVWLEDLAHNGNMCLTIEDTQMESMHNE